MKPFHPSALLPGLLALALTATTSTAQAADDYAQGLRLGLPLAGLGMDSYENLGSQPTSYLSFSLGGAATPIASGGIVGYNFGGPEVGARLAIAGYNGDHQEYHADSKYRRFALGPYFQYNFLAGQTFQPMVGVMTRFEIENDEYDSGDWGMEDSDTIVMLAATGGIRIALVEHASIDIGAYLAYGRIESSGSTWYGSDFDLDADTITYTDIGVTVSLNGWLLE